MTELALPSFAHKITLRGDKRMIFDVIRKKYVVLTPEEWVRQHFVHYLIQQHQYPRSLIAIETGLQYNRMARRTDIVVYGRDSLPFMVVECKAPSVQLTPTVFEQVAVYSQSLKSAYLTVTNGLAHYCCRMDYKEGTYHFVEELPAYERMSDNFEA